MEQSKNEIVKCILDKEKWDAFLEYKINTNHINKAEEDSIRRYIENEIYLDMYKLIEEEKFPQELPKKMIVNKQGTTKKRVVYSFSENVSITLKFIANLLYEFDDFFMDNCYAFRKNYGVRDAVKRIRRLGRDEDIYNKYCLKVDIKNYFNSIDVDELILKLLFVKEKDEKLFEIFNNILSEDRVLEAGEVIKENHGAMAGIPVAPFFANVYLKEIDEQFLEDKGYIYFRYSDDILLFGDSYDVLLEYQEILYKALGNLKLQINHTKENIYRPGEIWEFLGLSFDNGIIDISENTRKKMKGKIKRKADALRRWQRRKNISEDKAAKGFIKAMNIKFFGAANEDDFTFSRWFFPNINTDIGIKEIDQYMQRYIRYIITGRHYKGNYKIKYEKIKSWGYRSLVNEYYKKYR